MGKQSFVVTVTTNPHSTAPNAMDIRDVVASMQPWADVTVTEIMPNINITASTTPTVQHAGQQPAPKPVTTKRPEPAGLDLDVALQIASAEPMTNSQHEQRDALIRTAWSAGVNVSALARKSGLSAASIRAIINRR